MGVAGYLYAVRNLYKKLINETIDLNEFTLFIDGNCIVHKMMSENINFEEYNIDLLCNQLVQYIDEYITNNNVYICFDGIPPEPKQQCQQKRRENSYEITAALLPNTKLFTTLEQSLKKIYANNDKIFFSLSNEVGEGEQKMFLLARKVLKNNNNDKIVFISVDSDVLILSQLLQLQTKATNIYCIVETFNICVNITTLNQKFQEKNLLDRILFLCAISGNDFFPKLIDVKNKRCVELFQTLIRNKHVDWFSFFSVNKCNHKCSLEKIKCYVKLYKWYQIYFTTNEPITTDSYTWPTTPCSFCIDKYFNEFTYEPQILTNDSFKHLNFVLSNYNYYKDRNII